jgi:hypothetical protein
MPNPVHEYCSGLLEQLIYNSVPKDKFPNKFMSRSTTYNFYNLVGCGLKLNEIDHKEADGGVQLTEQSM